MPGDGLAGEDCESAQHLPVVQRRHPNRDVDGPVH
jgi:hypothetical protein